MNVLTRPRAASALSISLRSLDRLLASGELPRVRIGRRVVVLQSDVEALLEKCRVTTELAAH